MYSTMSTYLRAPPNSHEKTKHEFKKPEVTQKYKQPEIEKKKIRQIVEEAGTYKFRLSAVQ